MTETKENRIARQNKSFRKMIGNLKQDIAKSYQNKVMHDSYYQKIDFKEEVIIS